MSFILITNSELCSALAVVAVVLVVVVVTIFRPTVGEFPHYDYCDCVFTVSVTSCVSHTWTH